MGLVSILATRPRLLAITDSLSHIHLAITVNLLRALPQHPLALAAVLHVTQAVLLHAGVTN